MTRIPYISSCSKIKNRPQRCRTLKQAVCSLQAGLGAGFVNLYMMTIVVEGARSGEQSLGC